MASRLHMKVSETQTVGDGAGDARGAVSKRGEGRSDDGKGTNNIKPLTANKKKRKNKWRKKKGKSGAAGVSSAAAANGPSSELTLLLPDSAETTAPSEALFEKETSENQSRILEQRGRSSGDGGGILEGDDDREGLEAGKPPSHTTDRNLVACDAEVVAPSECSRATSTTYKTLDPFSSKDDEDATSEVDEFQDFQEGVPAPAPGRQPYRPPHPAQRGDISASKRQVKEPATTGSPLSSAGGQTSVEGDQNAGSTPAREVEVVEDEKEGKVTPEVKSLEVPEETKAMPWGVRLEAEEGVSEGDDVDDEESLLLVVATDTGSGSVCESASAPQQPKAEKALDAASDAVESKRPRSPAAAERMGESKLSRSPAAPEGVGVPSAGRVLVTSVVKASDAASDAGEPKWPRSPAASEGLGEPKRSSSPAATGGVGESRRSRSPAAPEGGGEPSAGRVAVTSVVDAVDALLAEVESLDLLSPPRPRRRGKHGEERKKPPGVDLPSIWEAVKEGDRTGVEAQLAAGAAIDETDSEGRTPLMIACATGDAAMTSLLVRHASPPASVTARTIDDWTPLMIAGGGGRLEVVKELLEAGAGLWDRDRVFGSNPLMWACGGGHAGVVRYMLQHGAQELLHAVNFDMWTPLMVACDTGSLETVRELVEAGADLDAYNKNSLTALDIAVSRNHLLLVYYLRTEGAFGSGEFWQATKAGDAPRVFRFIRDNGHLVKALDKNGRTALFEACVRGHVNVARVLVEAGADVNFRDPSGMTPLSVATVVGDVPLARFLAQLGGAKLSARNSAGWTPLMQVVAKGDLDMARFLVDRGAVVNDGSPDGESVLDMAARFTHPELEDYILSKGGFSVRCMKQKTGDAEKGKRGFFSLW